MDHRLTHAAELEAYAQLVAHRDGYQLLACWCLAKAAMLRERVAMGGRRAA